MDKCYLCDAELNHFMTIHILELPNGQFELCCEKCLDKEFPGWDEEDHRLELKEIEDDN